MAQQMDMSKAYDHIEWSYLLVVLHKMGFSAQWRLWIYQCVSSVSFQILLNGRPGFPFTESRGLHQGDSYLHTYLFFVWRAFQPPSTTTTNKVF